jgi:hypothetical protein
VQENIQQDKGIEQKTKNNSRRQMTVTVTMTLAMTMATPMATTPTKAAPKNNDQSKRIRKQTQDNSTTALFTRNVLF